MCSEEEAVCVCAVMEKGYVCGYVCVCVCVCEIKCACINVEGSVQQEAPWVHS